jgi:peptidyl-prolyl cis-trans isomerase C
LNCSGCAEPAQPIKKAGVTPLFFVPLNLTILMRLNPFYFYPATVLRLSCKLPSWQGGRWVFLPLLALLFSAAAAQQSAISASEILARGPEGVLISVADVLAELQRAPVAERQTILSKPEVVRQIASNLLVRRVLAAEAVREGAGADPIINAAIDIAKDRVLSDARLARLDVQNTPTEAALDSYARGIYLAKGAARFEKPAQTRASHILLDNTGPESLRKALELLTQLRAGASFEELAKANSTDPGSAARGGDLGFFAAGKMVPAFEDALNKLSKPGELSEPVQSQFGYHIIRLEERREKSQQPYEEVRDQLMREAQMAILNESRVQKSLALNKEFVFQQNAIETLAKSAAQ